MTAATHSHSKGRTTRTAIAMASVAAAFACVARAQAVTIETVPVGNVGNAGELSGAGAGGAGPNRICGGVNYQYNIGKYEVTAGQYVEFLNAVAKTDTYGVYNPSMWSHSQGCKIQRSGSPGSYTYSVAGGYANRPVNYTTWYDAARFANWLHNGQPTGSQGPGTTEDGSYLLTGVAPLEITREPDATWVIPSEDEWYKAAYHKNDGVTGHYWDYPTSSDSISTADANTAMSVGHTLDVGSYAHAPSPYGTFDQGGNVWEWMQAWLPLGTSRAVRGGSFYDALFYDLYAGTRDHDNPPGRNDFHIGFRVAAVPEPATVVLLAFGGLAVIRRRRRSSKG